MKILQFFMIFLTMWLLIVNFFLKENILDGISKLSFMQKKSKPSLMAFKTFPSVDLSKNDLECTIKKILLMLFGRLKNFLECKTGKKY